MRGLIALSLAGIAGLGWALTTGRSVPAEAARVPTAAPVALGPTRDFHVVAEAYTAVELAADRPIEARLVVRGALAVVPVERLAAGTRVELRWRLKTLDWAGVGATADSTATREALARHPVRATWLDDGRVIDFSYPPSAPGAVASLTELLLGELALPVEDGLEAQTGFGRAHTRVRRSRDRFMAERGGADYVALTGVPPDLADAALSGDAVGTLRADALGLVETTMREALAVEEAGETRWAARFEGTLRRIGTRDGVAPRAWAGVPRGRLIGAAERRALAGRVGDLTPGGLMAMLDAHALGGRLPDHHRAVWRAAGLLKLHPERCADLVPLYRREGMSPQGKGLLLDILVATGHGPAQAAMRAMLGQDDQTTRDFGVHLQRFSLIRTPEPASVDFLERLASVAQAPHLRRGAQAALGAAAAHLETADPDRARAIGHALARRLADADDPAETEAALLALGNTRQAAHAPAIAAHLRHDDVDVRMTAADALAGVHAPEARDGLIDALRDPSPGVRQLAWVRLANQPMTPTAITTLSATLAQAPLHRADLQTAVQTLGLLQERLGATAMRPAWDALRGRGDLDRRTRNQLRGMGPG